jgi:SAM-dependent methyltransferase
MAATGIEFDPIFAEDYHYFYGAVLDQQAPEDVEAIWRLLGLAPGMDVLDLPCGYGRIANLLAQRGCHVTAIDSCESFLSLARHSATQLGVPVEYVRADMRSLPWKRMFDGVVNWFTSFGYFDDDENRAFLRQVVTVLKPGGAMVMDLSNQHAISGELRHGTAEHVFERGDDRMIIRATCDPITSRVSMHWTISRDGQQRERRMTLRVFTFAELRNWILAAGLREVQGHGPRGSNLEADSPRLLVVARK